MGINPTKLKNLSPAPSKPYSQRGFPPYGIYFSLYLHRSTATGVTC